jgi:hypothetical protein
MHFDTHKKRLGETSPKYRDPVMSHKGNFIEKFQVFLGF